MKNNPYHLKKVALLLFAATTIAILLASCASFSTSLFEVDFDSAKEEESDGTGSTGIIKSAEALAKTFEDITPEQEYYIGRAVAAIILDKYEPYTDEAALEYINLLGQTLALFSDRPETFGGYHFMILDSDEINAFAAPGGLIFVTKGMLRCSKDEGDLAAILAHEIGHIQRKHGLKAIKQARLTTALVTIGKTAADAAMPESDLAELTDLFEDSILDITKTLVDSGYSKGQEREADKDGVEILRRTRYASRSLVDVLEIMETRLKPGGLDFAKTHPDPKVRMRYIERWIKNDSAPGKPPAVRQRRYSSFTAVTL